MKSLTVLVLAGGSGSRFWPLSGDKLLWQFGNTRLFQRTVIESLPKNADKIIVVTNEINEPMLKDLSYPAPVVFVRQPSAQGMADAILVAKEHLQDTSLFLMIADDWFTRDLPQQILNTAKQHNAFAIIPGWKTEAYFPGGYLELDGNRIVAVREKPGKGNEPSNYVNISGHYISETKRLLELLQSITSEHDDVYEQAVSQLMKEQSFILHEYLGPFASIKYPWHVLSVMDLFLSELSEYRGTNVQIKANVTIEGPVYIGNNVKIMEYSKIVGPCYIGDNTIIGNNNVIRLSMIGNNCVTGFSTDITRSYIGNDCWFHTNYIGDSVLEDNVSMGSGTVLANLRLDEGEIFSTVKEKRISTYRNKLGAMIGSRVRLGVNVSTMPGVKIGSDSFVGAGLTLPVDIPNSSFVKAKTELLVESNSGTVSTNRDQFKNKI